VALRVVFADDNFLVREGVSALLTETDDVELVDVVTDPAALLESVDRHRPDAVLTDIRMPPTFTTEGIDAAKRIRADHPSIGVVVLSQYVEEDYAFDLLSEGAAGLGYLLKERISQRDELLRALSDVARGGSVLDSQGRRGSAGAQGAGIAVTVARPDRTGARGPPGARRRAEQRGDGQSPVHEHPGRRETHQLALPEARLTDESDVNRRVMAVLAFLEATGGPAGR
jgi:DNA-binding NarL/FixJ family response regulator